MKLHLAADRMFFDWHMVGQIVPVEPAGSVWGPKHVDEKRKDADVRTKVDCHSLPHLVMGGYIRPSAFECAEKCDIRTGGSEAKAQKPHRVSFWDFL